MRCSPELSVRVGTLAADIMLCSEARHLTLTVPLSPRVYKCVPASVMLGASHQGGVEVLLVASCYRNRDKFRTDGSLGSYMYADLSFSKLALLETKMMHFGS